jgi:hypothetical protein
MRKRSGPEADREIDWDPDEEEPWDDELQWPESEDEDEEDDSE